MFGYRLKGKIGIVSVQTRGYQGGSGRGHSKERLCLVTLGQRVLDSLTAWGSTGYALEEPCQGYKVPLTFDLTLETYAHKSGMINFRGYHMAPWRN